MTRSLFATNQPTGGIHHTLQARVAEQSSPPPLCLSLWWWCQPYFSGDHRSRGTSSRHWDVDQVGIGPQPHLARSKLQAHCTVFVFVFVLIVVCVFGRSGGDRPTTTHGQWPGHNSSSAWFCIVICIWICIYMWIRLGHVDHHTCRPCHKYSSAWCISLAVYFSPHDFNISATGAKMIVLIW